MIDTIVLKVSKENYRIINHGAFIPSTHNMLKYSHGYKHYINNPTKGEIAQGIYKPRLTIENRGLKYDLIAEFSAPKIFFGNNLDELSENDFEPFIYKLQNKIADMGVEVPTEALKEAGVLKVHVSKNTLLELGITSSYILNQLNKIRISKKFDFKNIDFLNGGEAISFYNKSHSIVIYDKIKDLNKSESKATDKDQTVLQKSLYNQFKELNQEVLRFEFRLTSKKKINEVLAKLNYPQYPTLKTIFNRSLCRDIALFYWNEYFDSNNFLFDENRSSQEDLEKILLQKPNIKIPKALALSGVKQLCGDTNGITGLRTIIDRHNTKSGWNTVMEYFSSLLDVPWDKKPLFLSHIEKEMEEFKTFRVDDHQEYI
jgi:hypothetical protein